MYIGDAAQIIKAAVPKLQAVVPWRTVETSQGRYGILVKNPKKQLFVKLF